MQRSWGHTSPPLGWVRKTKHPHSRLVLSQDTSNNPNPNSTMNIQYRMIGDQFLKGLFVAFAAEERHLTRLFHADSQDWHERLWSQPGKRPHLDGSTGAPMALHHWPANSISRTKSSWLSGGSQNSCSLPYVLCLSPEITNQMPIKFPNAHLPCCTRKWSLSNINIAQGVQPKHRMKCGKGKW